ncbi:MAG: hypothetical protein ACTHNN_19420 [Xanthobacteraceae bacterium]
MSAYPSIKPPESLAEALTPIASLSEEEFARLADAVSGARSFSLSKEQIEDLKKHITGIAVVLPFTLGFLAYLYSQVSAVVEDGQESQDHVVAQLVEDLSRDADWDEGIKETMLSRLAILLSKKETHQRFKKIQRLQNGFIPNAVGFSSFVDLRPDFNEGSPEDIQGLLSIIQFRVSTDSDNPILKRLVFQMDEESLAELKKTVDRAYEKLVVLNADPAFSSRLIKI